MQNLGIIGESDAIISIFRWIERVSALSDLPLLITGETGTGKQVLAHAIHRLYPKRCEGPFVAVNCGAISPSLAESELFGHRKGAFTGADEHRVGLFEFADGGTIFLDEIGELSPAMQVALLRVLQEGEFERVGGTETLKTDVRVVVATNRNLDEAVRDGSFRCDLLIAEHYASHYASKLGKRITGLSPRALVALEAYPWPGNVRELQNVLERAVILASGELLQPADLELPGVSAPTSAAGESSEERARIEEALRAARGRVSGTDGAAAALGVAASTLEARIRRLRIDKFSFRTRVRD